MTLRSGITTGACAAAAAKAAALMLVEGAAPAAVEIGLPGGQTIRVAVASAQVCRDGAAASAAVRKDAGDDPDVTDGLEVVATVAWAAGAEVTFAAGEGVGTVTKPGLQVPPGEPAINPAPRRMIAAAIRDVTPRGVRVEIAVPGGREVARQTFNPRLGIAGGLSILGTTGIVRPYCRRALHDALRCALDVAAACGVRAPVLAPGNIGAKAARRHFALADEQLVEVGNAWHFVLDLLAAKIGTSPRFDAVLLVGHPGKLAKLAAEHWDTHSSRSPSAAPAVARLHQEVFQRPAADVPTVEGIFAALQPADRTTLAQRLAGDVQRAVARGLGRGDKDDTFTVAVFLVNMAGACLGTAGDLTPWR